ncbi:MAG: thiamine-phosphate kinase [Planctomycetia bacterium]|nr:thiamine-phosphate kinase [Planctomycetia bacterium]
MENELVAQFRKVLPASEKLLIGPGDDAAVLRTSNADTVLTVDMLTDGVDFIVGETDPRLIGRKALAVNLSDLAAMAALPHSVLVAVVLPQDGGEQLAVDLLDGMLPLANEFDIAIAGGDTNAWDGKLAVSITAIGQVSPFGVIRRSGARPGDRILCTGSLGGSIFSRQFLFQPRIREALYLNEHYKIHAAMDISDGLLLDLSRMADESGLGFQIDESKIPVHPDVLKYKDLLNQSDPNPNRDPLPPVLRKSLRKKFKDQNPESREFQIDRALSDGEDFELILAAAPEETKRLLNDQPFADQGLILSEIGFFQEERNSFRKGLDGTIRPLAGTLGFVHRFK